MSMLGLSCSLCSCIVQGSKQRSSAACLQAGSSDLSVQLRQSSAGTPTGQPALESPSLRCSSQVSPDDVKLTIKTIKVQSQGGYKQTLLIQIV